MKRLLGLFLILGLALGAVALAQDDPPDILKKKVRVEDPKKDPKDKPPEKDPKKDDEPKRELPELEKFGDDQPGENPAVIVERIKKNLAESENRLDKKDPGEDTRKIQDKIVKDLDELIKQQNDDDGGGGGGGGGGKGGKGRKGGGGGGGSAKKGGGGGGGGGNTGGGGGGQASKNPGTKGGKDGKGGGGMGGKGGKKHNTIADVSKDIWGHLPLNKRQEMDAYSKERFMPRYSELLRQYYRTIAEQNSHKEGD